MVSGLVAYLPLVLIAGWSSLLVLVFSQSPPSPPPPRTSRPTTLPTHFFITARRMTASRPSFVRRKINISDSVVYVDMWGSHWCTYYNDREFFFTPRINELLQRLRGVGFPIVHISMGVDAYDGRTKQRRAGRDEVAKGNLSVLESYNALTARYHRQYIPEFVDACVYSDQEWDGKYSDNHFTKVIAMAEDDYFVQNFKESAMAFVGLGRKTVIVFGQHTNMCLMAVFLYCREVGLDLIIVRDLVDSCWLYEYQKYHCRTHSEGNVAVNAYFDEQFGSSILSYDLICELRNLNGARRESVYDIFTNVAMLFKHLQ
jgi:hypothetical protein